MKKSFVTMVFILGINCMALGCQIIIENDMGTWIAVTDLQANHPTEFVTKKIKIDANKNPDTYADLRIVIGPRGNSESYRIKQIACSQSHTIPIKASNIKAGNLDSSLFTITKEN